ncbi:MAG TPA: hypothetical protein VM600_06505, partial [Actinomycetota bacterium]|nr:hypothetical protein [Actinomycetota bacterium]
MSRRTRGSIAVCFVALAVAAPSVPEYLLAKSDVAGTGGLASYFEALLMALLGAGLVAFASSIRR